MPRYVDIDKYNEFLNSCGDRDYSCVNSCTECYFKCNNGETEDVAPVIHAKWKLLENDDAYDGMFTYECSNCLSELCMSSDAFASYCPNCGAKMNKD